jgi:RND family efflux transporter MFP subunit
MDSLEIEVDVNESYIAKVSIGQRVDAVLDAYPEWHIPCKVRTVIPTADRQKATVKVRIAFDSLDPRIVPDMGVKVSFLSGEDASYATSAQSVIPKDAVQEREGTQVVFLVKEGRIQRHAVQLGPIRGADVEIVQGVSPGDEVVVRDLHILRDGQRVKVE